MPNVRMSDVAEFAEEASDYFDQLQRQINKPNPSKAPPSFSSNAISELCHIDRSQMRNLAKKHSLPTGQPNEGSKAKEYTIGDAMAWIEALGQNPKRNREAGELGRTYAVINYKGGVSKTTTAVSLAQGLSLRGQKVLLVDCDPQGSATQLFGIDPEKDIDHETTTVMPFLYGDVSSLEPTVLPTYWAKKTPEGSTSYISLIPACSAVLLAEVQIANIIREHTIKEMEKQLADESYVPTVFPFWLLLRDGLEPLRKEFDVIILDTPPSLGNWAVNVMFAADGLIMPTTPEKLDFTSSIKYWNVFQGLISMFPESDKKEYDFITILPTMVKSTEDHRLVKAQMKRAFGTYMSAIEIPESTAITQLLALDRTIFDVSKPIGSYEAYRRYKEPMNTLVDYVLLHLETAWKANATESEQRNTVKFEQVEE